MADKLEKLEKELYKKEDEELSRRMRRRIIFPQTLQRLSTVWEETKKENGPKEFLKISRRKILKWVFISAGTITLILASLFLFLYLGTRGNEAEVIIHDRGPIESGELITISIVSRNTSSVTLADVELTVILPSGSLVASRGQETPAPSRLIKKIGSIRAGEENITEIPVRIFGAEGEGKEIQAILLYQPENLHARFSSKTSETIRINQVPLGINWEIPEVLSQRQEVGVKIKYTSSASRPFHNMWLRLEYPPGFQFSSGAPKPEFGNEIWKLGTLEGGKEGFVTIKGTVIGEEGEVKSFRGELGVFNPLTKEWRSYRGVSQSSRIAVTPLSVQIELDGTRQEVITPGQDLSFTIRYKNNTEFPLKNISIKVLLQGKIIDLTTLDIQDGVLDFPTRAIVWAPGSAEELKEVAPGEGGEFNFRIKTREGPIVQSIADKNQTVKVSAEILTGLAPQELQGTELASRDVLEFKIKTKISFLAKSLHRFSPLVNSGPLPPKVGSKTFYTVVWEVRNYTNDLRDAEIKAILPPNVQWENNFTPKDTRVSLDFSLGEVRWRVGEIKAGTGVLTPALTLAFQVSLIPSEVETGEAVTLLNESRLTGFDAFIGESREEKHDPLTTELRADSGTSEKDWRVVR